MFATGAISYAIVRHRLMDLGVVFRSVLIYVGMVVVLGAGLVILLFLVDPILHLGFTGSAFFAAVCAALVVHPVRRNVELVVDKYFFRGRYNYQAALSEFSASMTKILDLTDLQDRIVHEVAAILQVKTAALFLWEPTEQRYVVRALLPLSLGESHPGFAAASQAAQRMNRERTLLVREELRRALPQAEFAPLEREFDRVGAEVFIPLIYRGELIGLLTLGEKTSTDIFSSEDLNLLGTLGNQAAVALENAQLHHTVTMLKNHNENILKYMSSGVIAIDRDQIVTTCNDKARDILNLPAYVLPNRTIDILPPQLRSMLAETLEEKAIYPNHELQILSEAGSIKHLSASTSLLRDEKSEVTGALLVFTDLTDLKLLESEMWRADKLASLGTLAAGMAHEIKNPLVSIKTFAQLLPTRFEDKDFRDTFAAITVDEVERINSIVEKLLEFARPTAPVFEQVDVIETIEEVLLLISAEASKHDVALTRNFEADSAPIIGDKAQLKQALLNLCLNGLQAVSELEHRSSGELTIAVGFRKRRNRAMGDFSLDEIAQLYYGTEVATSTDDAEMLVIKVSDNGRGISREDLPRIFDPFFTTKKKGMGLGLAVVHGIIKEHSGNITVDSAEGGGTEFVVALPVTQLFAKERV
jgi:two-component system sensor histidine kinase AtoS